MELSIAYEIIGPDGTRVVLGNGDPATVDPDWIGFLDPESGISGLLDGADIEENVDSVVAGDGGVQGPNFRGRRQGTIQGVIAPNASTQLAETYIQKLKRASAALRGDALLRWTPTSDGIQRRMRLRRQSKPAFAGRRPKTFQLVMSSPDALVLAATESAVNLDPAGGAGEVGYADPMPDPIVSDLNVSAQQSVTNQGDQPTWPRFRIYGPITNPILLNNTTGKRIEIAYTLLAGEWLDVFPETGQILLYQGGAANLVGNPSGEVDAAGYAVGGDAGGTPPASVVDAQAPDGARILRAVTTGVAAGFGALVYNNGGAFVPVVAGQSYSHSVRARAPAGSTCLIYVDWFDGAGAYISTSVLPTAVAMNGAFLAVRNDGAIAPASAAKAQLLHRVYGAPGGSNLDFDLVTLSRTPLASAGADRYSAYQFATSEWWQLLSGANDIRLLSAAFAAGAGAIIYWRHAWD